MLRVFRRHDPDVARSFSKWLRWILGQKAARLGLFTLIVLLVSAPWIFQAQIGDALMKHAAENVAGRDATRDLADGLHIALCGSGSPVPDPGRAGPCSLVIAGTHVFVVDAGEGGARNIVRMGMPVDRIDAVFITHFHSDHINGLGSLMTFHWGYGANPSPLEVFGPTGIDAVVSGFDEAYSADFRYRTAFLGERLAPSAGAGARAHAFAPPSLSAEREISVWERDGVRVVAFSVDHSPVEPAVGYRFEYKGRSVVFSGDTRPTPSLARAAQGADVLVHEALQPRLIEPMTSALVAKGLDRAADVMRRITEYHSTPAQAADQAQAAHVRYLVLNHIGPPLPFSYLYPAFLGDARRHFHGPVMIGEDGLMISLSPGGTSVEVRNLL